MDVEDDVRAAVDHIGIGGVEQAEGGGVATQQDVATGGAGGDLLEVEDVTGDVGELGDLLGGDAGEVEGLFDHRLKVVAGLSVVAGQQGGLRLDGDGEGVRHLKGNARGGGEVDVLELECCDGAVDGGVEGGLDAEGGVELAEQTLGAAGDIEGADAGVGGELDGAA